MTEDPQPLIRHMRERLDDVTVELRRDIDRVDDPQFKALFEVSAEVLMGLAKAFRDYEEKSESAWCKLARTILP